MEKHNSPNDILKNVIRENEVVRNFEVDSFDIVIPVSPKDKSEFFLSPSGAESHSNKE